MLKLLTIVAVLFANIALADGEDYDRVVLSTETKRQVAIIAREMGRIMPEAETPALYQMTKKVFERIAATQNRKIEENYVPLNYIFIIDSPFANMFIHHPKEPGVRVAVNLVFITTAMLRKIFDVSEAALRNRYRGLSLEAAINQELELGPNTLAGLAAHEMAHPLDELVVKKGQAQEAFSIEKEYGKRASHAVELRADGEGVAILREANLPEQSILWAFQRIFNLDLPSDMVAALTSTHPEPAMRMTLMRMLLTGVRFSLGKNQALKPFKLSEFNRDGLLHDLKRIQISQGPIPWVMPESLTATMNRLRRIGTIEDEKLNRIEMNRLLIAMNFHINKLEAQGGVPDEMVDKVIETLRHLNSTGRWFYVWSTQERIDALSGLEDSWDLLKLPTHYRSVQTLKFYRNPKFIEALDKMHREEAGKILPVPLISRFIPTDVIVERYLDQYMKLKMSLMGNDGSDNPMQVEDRDLAVQILIYAQKKYGTSIQSQADFANVFKHFSRLNVPFFMTSNQKASDFYKANQNTERIIRQTRVLANGQNPEAVAAWNQIVEFTKWFWENRGYFAVSEFIHRGGSDFYSGANYESINWRLVAEILGLDRNQIGNQIAKAVEEAFKNGLHTQLTDFINKSSDDYLQGKRKPSELISFTNPGDNTPFWFNSRLTNQLVQVNRNSPPDPKAEIDSAPRTAGWIFGRSLVASDPGTRFNVYRQFVTDYFSQPQIQVVGLPTVHTVLHEMERVFTQQWGVKSSSAQGPGHISPLGLAMGISDATGLNPEQKQLLLNFIFLRDKRFTVEQTKSLNKLYYDWLSEPKSEVLQIIGILRQNGVIHSYRDFVTQLVESPYYPPIQNTVNLVGTQQTRVGLMQKYYETLDRVVEGLIPELAAKTPLTKEELIAYAQLLNVPYRLKIDRTYSNTPNIQDYRDLIAKHAAQHVARMTDKEKISFFLTITGSGASKGTDAFFAEYMMKMPGLTTTAQQLNWMKGALIVGRINSKALQLEVAKLALEPRIKDLAEKAKTTNVSKYDLNSLISDLNLMVPGGSLARDEFLEQIAGRLNLKDTHLFAFIEDQKTTNWRRQNPDLVSAGSFLSSAVQKLSRMRRIQLTRYLMDPKANPSGLPEEIIAEFRSLILRQLHDDDEKANLSTNGTYLARKANSIARTMKLKIEGYLRDAAPTERIPLIEILLTSGSSALLNDRVPEHAWKAIIEEFLEYDEAHSKLLLSYLTVIDPHEVAPSLAYILSQAKTDKSTTATLFTVFGTVGIKFAQFSSIFKLFGPKVAEETKHLKNKAPSLTLHQIYQQMHQHLNKDAVQAIQVEKKLAAASIKTIVRVRLPDGRRVVMGVQPEPVFNQIQTNLDLGDRFLNELERRNLVNHSAMLGTLIEALREQVVEEIDFELESKRYAIADKYLKAFSATDQAFLHGWRLEVPTLVEGTNEFYKNAEGRKKIVFYKGAWRDDDHLESTVSFDDLEEKLKDPNLTQEQRAQMQRMLSEIGEVMVRSSLAMLFRYGYFDADRHKGNWLIDVEHKTIYALDFGQLETFDAKNPFLYDPRLTVVQFLQAVEAKEVDAIYWAMTNMRKSGTKAPILSPKIREAIQKALQNTDYADVLIDLIKPTTEAGLKFDRRYSFGAMKGLLTLYGEKYVSDAKFFAILKEEATKLGRRKLPALAIEKAKGAMSCAVGLARR